MEIRQIVRKLRAMGWEVVPTNGGHLKALPPDGGRFIIMSASPSDFRAGRNALSLLRRYGHDLRP